MAAWAVAARRAPSLIDALRLYSQSQASGAHAAKLLHRRCLAGGGDHHGPPKVNFWQDPLSPYRWKEEHKAVEGTE